MSLTLHSSWRLIRRIVVPICLLALSPFLLTPAIALADAPVQTTPGSEPCAECHWSETAEWSPSHHAAAGVTCESCHGPYVEDHPTEGLMTLSVEAETCSECHPRTHAQWQGTLHAEAGVNCINCHVPHSQTTRLSAERLCCSCHARSGNNACNTTPHKVAGITCIDCHISMPSAQASESGTVAGIGDIVAPDHEFTAIPSQLCVNCHGDTLHKPAQFAHNELEAASIQVGSLTERAENLAEQLETAEQKNSSLRALAILALGLGLGIGVALGLVVMLVLGYITQRKGAGS